jgi:hypothetical protein
MTNPKNKNQQRKLLENIGAKAVNEAILQMEYDPKKFSNDTPAGVNNRLWLERNLLVDDLPRAGIRK